MQKKMLDKQTVLLTVDLHYMDKVTFLIFLCSAEGIKSSLELHEYE